MGPVVLTKARESQWRRIAAIASDAGVNLKDCYQRGKCTAGCPVASEADMGPRQLIRNMQLGLLELVMESTLPWLCVNCGICFSRCPQNVDMPSLNEAVCRYAMAQGAVTVREGERFMNVFLDNVQRGGVSDETLLAMRFNMETGRSASAGRARNTASTRLASTV
ncbi:MAG: 4Fe-4S dicluster domain-containing protein [Slackia faecicanis]|nr:4Fe-4S dicluster domain-containing protein [Slackia faecicanis]